MDHGLKPIEIDLDIVAVRLKQAHLRQLDKPAFIAVFDEHTVVEP